MSLKQVSFLIIAMGFSTSLFAAENPSSPVRSGVKPESNPVAAESSGQQAMARRQPGMAHEQFLQRLKVELSLTDQQVQEIRKIHQATRAKAVEHRQQGPADELQQVFGLAPDSSEYDEAVRKAADAAAANARERISTMAENRKKIYALLDDEQKKKFLELKPAPQQRPMLQHRQGPGKKSAEQ